LQVELGLADVSWWQALSPLLVAVALCIYILLIICIRGVMGLPASGRRAFLAAAPFPFVVLVLLFAFVALLANSAQQREQGGGGSGGASPGAVSYSPVIDLLAGD